MPYASLHRSDYALLHDLSPLFVMVGFQSQQGNLVGATGRAPIQVEGVPLTAIW